MLSPYLQLISWFVDGTRIQFISVPKAASSQWLCHKKEYPYRYSKSNGWYGRSFFSNWNGLVYPLVCSPENISETPRQRPWWGGQRRIYGKGMTSRDGWKLGSNGPSGVESGWNKRTQMSPNESLVNWSNYLNHLEVTNKSIDTQNYLKTPTPQPFLSNNSNTPRPSAIGRTSSPHGRFVTRSRKRSLFALLRCTSIKGKYSIFKQTPFGDGSMGQYLLQYIYHFRVFWNEDPFAKAEKGSCECKAAFAMQCSSIFRTFPSPFQFAAPWICCFPKVQLWSRTPLVIHSTRLPCGVPRRTVGYCGGSIWPLF